MKRHTHGISGSYTSNDSSTSNFLFISGGENPPHIQYTVWWVADPGRPHFLRIYVLFWYASFPSITGPAFSSYPVWFHPCCPSQHTHFSTHMHTPLSPVFSPSPIFCCQTASRLLDRMCILTFPSSGATSLANTSGPNTGNNTAQDLQIKNSMISTPPSHQNI